MPFRIFCSGNDSFHLGYSQVPVLGDVYDIQAAMGYLTTAGTEGGRAAVQAAVSDEMEDPDAPADDHTERTMRAFDSITGTYTFRQGVGFAMSGRAPLRVALDAHSPGWLYSDAAFASTTLYPDDLDPAETLLRAINPALEVAGLNCAGVLGHIGIVLSEFSAWRCDPYGPEAPARYLLNISVTRL